MPSEGNRTDAGTGGPAGDVPEQDPEHEPEHLRHLRDAFEEVYEAAIEAEFETGVREETEQEARRSVIIRLARVIGGFTVIGVGIAALPLPGPGWLIIIFGLGLLPYAWAQRTIRLIRRRIPGIPEDGRIPTHTWIIMGTIVVGGVVISIVWGAAITQWISGLWGDPDKLLL